MSKDGTQGRDVSTETILTGDLSEQLAGGGESAPASFEQQVGPAYTWRDPSTETETVRILIDAALSCPSNLHSDPVSSPPPFTTTARHERKVAPRKRTHTTQRQSWFVSDLELACIAFGVRDTTMPTSAPSPVATRASARLRKGKEREAEQRAIVTAPAVALKLPKRRSELSGQPASSTVIPSAGPQNDIEHVTSERTAVEHSPSEQATVDYTTDKAHLIEVIESRAASLRQKERHTMASLYKARIERQILLTARQTIDLRLRELHARRARGAAAQMRP